MVTGTRLHCEHSFAWWPTFFPGMAIFVTVLAFNLMGDGLRDAFDPRHQNR